MNSTAERAAGPIAASNILPSRTHLEASTGRAPWRPNKFLLICGAWTLIALLISASVFLDANGGARSVPVPRARVVITFIEAYIWAAFTPLVFWLVRRYATEQYRVLTRIMVLTVVGVVMAIGVATLIQFLRRTFSNNDVNVPYAAAGAIGIAVEALTYTGVLIAGFARLYLRRFQDHREAALALQAQTVQLKAQLADARLSALRAQLNPHFLFNTLHAISALTNRDPAGVRRMLARLSDLLRISLDEINEAEIPLQRELDFVRQYFELMRIQFQSLIDIREDIDAATLDALVPTLLLQPLVENAIKHGISLISTPGRLSISAQRVAEQLRLRITNNGPADPAAFAEGVGLRNTRERLLQLYGAQQSFRLTHDAQSQQFVVEIHLPFHVAPLLDVAGLHAINSPAHTDFI